jgi:hypothetical protein
MKKVLHILTLLLAFATITSAQAPWRAKLYFHFTDSNNTRYTDTLWFGFDQAGDISYQPELDELDTAIRYNRAYINNSLVRSQYNTFCGNMKKDIREFKDKVTRYEILAFGKLDSISYDRDDFVYLYDSINRISKAVLYFHNFFYWSSYFTYHQICSDVADFKDGKWLYGGFSLSNFNTIPEVRQFSLLNLYCNYPGIKRENTYGMSLELYYGWWVGNEKTNRNTNNIRLIPNPAFSHISIYIEENDSEYLVELYSIDGRKVLEKSLQPGNNIIDITSLNNGLYNANFSIKSNSDNSFVKKIKLIKL